MKKYIILLFTLFSVTAAYSQQYIIKANFTGFKDQTKFYLTDLDNKTIIDSAVIINNTFTMTGKLSPTPDNLRLYTIYENQFCYAFFFIGNDTVTISADKADLPFNFKITGSKNQDVENILYNQTKDIAKQHNDLLVAYHNLKGDSVAIKSKQIFGDIAKLSAEDELIRRKFIKEHLNSFAGVAELTSLKADYDKDTLQQMYNALQPLYKQSKYGQRIAAYLKVGDLNKVGDTYSDFTAVDNEGNLRKLSDIKGKYILLDFSINACIPCIESVKDMKRLATQFPDKLAIVSFSADANKKTWLNSVNRDKPTWLTLWDGKGNESEALKKYGVSGYPAFFLIDPNGKIVWTTAGYDDGMLVKGVAGVIGQ